HRVVDDAAVGRGDEDVLALPDVTLAEIAGNQHVREVERVRPGDLELTLDTDVPEGHPLQQRPVLADRVAVVPGVIGVVVHAVHRGAGSTGFPEIRGFPESRVQQDRGCAVRTGPVRCGCGAEAAARARVEGRADARVECGVHGIGHGATSLSGPVRCEVRTGRTPAASSPTRLRCARLRPAQRVLYY